MQTPCLVRGRETQGPLNAVPELVIPQAILTSIENRPQNCASKKAYKQEVVEMSGLKRGVLTIVGKAEKFAFVPWNGVVGPIHPLQST